MGEKVDTTVNVPLDVSECRSQADINRDNAAKWEAIGGPGPMTQPGQQKKRLLYIDPGDGTLQDSFGEPWSFDTGGGGGGDPQDLFSQIAASGEDPIIADSPTTTLNIAVDGGLSLTLDDTTKTITIDATGLGGGGGGGDFVQGFLATDLTSSMASATVNVVRYSGTDPGAPIVATNPARSSGSMRVFSGNEGGFVRCTYYTRKSGDPTGWYFDEVQNPSTKPVAP